MLILNAGILTPPHTITEDGLELSYQVNYLSHHYLARLLERVLIRSAPSRIVNVSSESHRSFYFVLRSRQTLSTILIVFVAIVSNF